MTEWTSEAKKERDAYLSLQRDASKGQDINAEDVIDDIRHHIDEELKELTIVTREDVARVIRQLGPPQNAERITANEEESRTSANQLKKPGAVVIVLGIVLPLIALIFELVGHACAGAFFDPIPSWWHVALVASVPIVNSLIVRNLRSKKGLVPNWLLGANAATLVVCLFYAIAFATLCIPGIMAVFYFGFGLLPMAPLFSLIATFQCRRYLSSNSSLAKQKFFRISATGALLAFTGLAILEVPTITTRIALELADDEQVEKRNAAIRFLRHFGHEDTMLRACYERPRKFTNLAALTISRKNTLNQSEARTIFFRATGRPFNGTRPPSLYSREGRWQAFDELTWEFDEDRGGAAVAGRVKGLFLSGSRMDCRIHSQAGLAYLEWTFEFTNRSDRQKEARTQILLPPDGVVSRLTLWINGEEREAAFAGRAQVREAYEKIVRQRRDPVLVTTTGKDRILMQCFPVPADGGTMKTRMGITIPLTMLTELEGKLLLPKMIERNFNLNSDLEHAVWIESRSELKSNLSALTKGSKDEQESTLHGQIIDSELLSPNAAIHVTRADAPTTVWAESAGEFDLTVQEFKQSPGFTPDRLVLVLDGSEGMAPFYNGIAETLQHLPEEIELIVFHASDSQRGLDARTAPAKPQSKTEASDLIRSYQAEGGQDNLKWLVRAWDIAAADMNSAVLWIHGSQPVVLSSEQALKQRLERSPNNPKVFEIQTTPGPNRLLEDLGITPIKRIARLDSLSSDLQRWIESLDDLDGPWTFARERHSQSTQDEWAKYPQVTDHISRLWAAAQIEALAQQRSTPAAIALAQRHQLVTSVSGAVVLETAAQFKAAGLKPVDIGTVPVIPEPETWLLMLFGFIVLYIGCKPLKIQKQRG